MKHLILNEQANEYRKLNQFDSAIISYEEAISIRPDYAETYYNLGDLYHKLGQLDKAVRSFKKVVAINPDYSHKHKNKILTVIYFFQRAKLLMRSKHLSY